MQKSLQLLTYVLPKLCPQTPGHQDMTVFEESLYRGNQGSDKVIWVVPLIKGNLDRGTVRCRQRAHEEMQEGGMRLE